MRTQHEAGFLTFTMSRGGAWLFLLGDGSVERHRRNGNGIHQSKNVSAKSCFYRIILTAQVQDDRTQHPHAGGVGSLTHRSRREERNAQPAAIARSFQRHVRLLIGTEVNQPHARSR